MRILPINNQTGNINPKFSGYRNLSKQILNSERAELINIAEYFHNAEEAELKQIAGSNSDALSKLKEAIKGVITRKKCYLADGSSFCKQRAEELEQKAAQRQSVYAIA